MFKKYLARLDPNIWLILAFSIFAWAPLLTPAYFFEAHDARHSVFFLVEFDQTFRDGYWWPRWSPDFAFGYGYPLFNLYAPLAFYAAELLHLLGLGITAAVKTMYVSATIAAGLGMYGLVKGLFGRQAGLLAAIVYMYAPFHLVEIYVRSAYAEFVALAIIPFLFWAFTGLVTTPSPRRIALAGLTYGLLALTHHTTFVAFTPLLLVYLLYLLLAQANWQWRLFVSRAAVTLAAGLLGLALAAIYLGPMLLETRYIKVEQWTSGSYNYLQHFVYFAQLFAPSWGYGYAGPGLLDDLPFQLGIVVGALSCFALVNLVIKPLGQRGAAIFFLAASLMVVWLMSPLAEPVWQVIPIAALVQFPWRLLGMAAFTMSVVAGSLLGQTNPTHEPASADPNLPISQSPLYLLTLVVILASFPYTLPQYTDIPAWAETPLAVVNWDRASIVDRVGLMAATQEQPQTSPMEQQYLNGEPLTVAGIVAGQGQVETLRHGGSSDEIKVTAPEPVTVQFYTYDYPGWRVELDGASLAHRPEPPYGLITVDLPPGEHVLHLWMGSTPPRTVGAVVSGLALLLLVGLFFWPNKL